MTGQELQSPSEPWLLGNLIRGEFTTPLLLFEPSRKDLGSNSASSYVILGLFTPLSRSRFPHQ